MVGSPHWQLGEYITNSAMHLLFVCLRDFIRDSFGFFVTSPQTPCEHWFVVLDNRFDSIWFRSPAVSYHVSFYANAVKLLTNIVE